MRADIQIFREVTVEQHPFAGWAFLPEIVRDFFLTDDRVDLLGRMKFDNQFKGKFQSFVVSIKGAVQRALYRKRGKGVKLGGIPEKIVKNGVRRLFAPGVGRCQGLHDRGYIFAFANPFN